MQQMSKLIYMYTAFLTWSTEPKHQTIYRFTTKARGKTYKAWISPTISQLDIANWKRATFLYCLSQMARKLREKVWNHLLKTRQTLFQNINNTSLRDIDNEIYSQSICVKAYPCKIHRMICFLEKLKHVHSSSRYHWVRRVLYIQYIISL